MTKWVYSFGAGHNEGRADMRNLLGGKGANLAEMASIDLPVPPGFTITTEVCTAFYDNGRKYPGDLDAQVKEALTQVEQAVGLRFGDEDHPLLVSVRSGARVSMPGMMDTVLNLGLNDATVGGLAKASGDPRFAWDSYRRFIQMYGSVVLGVDHHRFEEIIESAKIDAGVTEDTGLSAEHWQQVVSEYKSMVQTDLGRPFPQEPGEQMWGAIGAVFGSWMNPRANTYRRLHDIPASWGTAVNVQAMVFGNMGEDCATGVCFTRDPSTGEDVFYGEFLVNAQGEDVVAGIRTPQPLSKLRAKPGEVSMEEALPAVYQDLVRVRATLETHYKDMQDIEFTVQQQKLYMLQTRSGKRTAAASLRIAVEMAEGGLIDRKEAVRRVNPASLDQLLHPTLDPNAPRTLISKGLPASPGAASGIVVFNSDEAEMRAAKGEPVILVRVETSPEDIHGMHAARGIVTTRGGMTSHAAVVARGMGRPCVSGAGGISVDYGAQTLTAGGRVVRAGDTITLDGATGEVFAGSVAMVEPAMSGDFATLMQWADELRRMKVRTNAETPLDAETARKFGAEGIGLCRTEHMFFDPARIGAVRQMIMAQDERGRRAALAKLLPFQRDDFRELFRIMAGLPVTIRLLDPPLHEFLPHQEAELADVAAALGEDLETIRRRADELKEANPMLGHRGCRLGITFPEIYEMQGPRDLRGGHRRHRGGRPRAGAGDHDPAGRYQAGAGDHPCAGGPGRGRGVHADRQDDRVLRRHHDRAAARRADRGQHRVRGGFLLVRHQRPDADRVRPVARRRRQVPAAIRGAGHPAEGPVRVDRRGRRGRPGPHRRREGPPHQEWPEDGHLRRARRRPGLHCVLRGSGAGLRLLLPLSRPGRAAGCGAGHAGRRGR